MKQRHLFRWRAAVAALLAVVLITMTAFTPTASAAPPDSIDVATHAPSLTTPAAPRDVDLRLVPFGCLGALGVLCGGQVSSVGRIVHFVMPNGKHRPAIIVEDWGNSPSVNLQVFTDGSNDGAGVGNVEWHTSVLFSESPSPRTWHWPERVEPPASA